MANSNTKTFFLIFILIIPSAHSGARDTLTPTSPLADGETLVSAGGGFALGFFTPPDSKSRYVGVWFNNIPIQTVVWVANRNEPVTGPAGRLSVSAAGALAITAGNNRSAAVWSTGPTSRMRNPVATLLDTGNLVVREASGAAENGYAWQSFDYPTDTLIAGMKIGVDRKRNLSWNLTAWRSANDPTAGQYCGVMEAGGDPEMFLWSGGRQIWRTGPWNGVQFSGVPDSTTYAAGFAFEFVDDGDEVSYSYSVANPRVVTRLVVNYTGVAQRHVWKVGVSAEWNMFWYAPRDQCDAVSPCGPYGVCDPNRSPVCACAPGFDPRAPAEWALRDGTDGCGRRTALDCGGGTDGFAVVGGAKLPDTTAARVEEGVGLAECRAACLANCSCTAYASANVSGGGSGCVMWAAELTDIRVYAGAGQDLYVRLAAADLGPTSSESHNSRRVAIIVVVSVVLGILSLGCAGCFIWRTRRRRRGRRKRALLGTTSITHCENDGRAETNDLELPLFDFDTIATATDNFSSENKLGEGGFGPVYKGKLGEEQEIAVKRLAKSSMQGLDEFKTEVMLIAKLQHRNLVRLLGCCIQGGERMLIYEYMSNKSLDIFLFDKVKGALLDWQTRCKIIIGIARGLLYLHQDSRLRIIHRDLKASNILLDKEMNPKISDFGMARIFGGDVTEVNTQKVVGTYGYMSPEYAMDGIFSVKSDVFSFGVLVLEIISGKRNRGVYSSSPHLNLLGQVWSLWNQGQTSQTVDESLGQSFPMNEVSRFIKVGLLCVQERPEDRPLISTILIMLGSESSDDASLPQPKQPGFVARRVPLETEWSSSKIVSTAFDDTNITIFEGR